MGGIARLPEILTTYRVHSASVSSLYTKQQRLNAVRGLAFKLTRWFGDEAEDVAGRTLGLLQSRNESPSNEEFARLGGDLERLLTAYSTAKQLDPESHAEIVGDASRLWWEVASGLARQGRKEALSIYRARRKLARASWSERILCGWQVPRRRFMRAAARSLSVDTNGESFSPRAPVRARARRP
jgi:hypothetical protein